MPRARKWLSLLEFSELIEEALIWYKLEHGRLPPAPVWITEDSPTQSLLGVEVGPVLSCLTNIGIQLPDETVVPGPLNYIEGPWIDESNHHVYLRRGTLGSGSVLADYEALGPGEVEQGLRLHYGGRAGYPVMVPNKEADAALEVRYGVGLAFAQERTRWSREMIARAEAQGTNASGDVAEPWQPTLRTRRGRRPVLTPDQFDVLYAAFVDVCRAGRKGEGGSLSKRVAAFIFAEFGLQPSVATIDRIASQIRERAAREF